MIEGTFTCWIWLFPLAACIYLVLIRQEEKRFKARKLCDEDYLHIMARMKNISEYDVFGLASEAWYHHPRPIDDDFENYLKYLEMPHYVRDFLRKNKPALDRHYRIYKQRLFY
jgi:hypothetical protein